MFSKANPLDESDAAREVRRYAEWVLKKASVGNRLPTPVTEIVSCAKLAVAEDISLSEVHAGFFTKTYGLLKSALSKLRALIDLRSNIIYLDLTMLPQQVNFATLHDCGHSVLPWQRNAYRYEDDDQTLSPEIEAKFEREANLFAAEVLFQLERFTKEAADFPLAIRTPVDLSKRYGASCHAAIRRYVESHNEACAVLVCRPFSLNGQGSRQLEVEHLIYSVAFRSRFGELRISPVLDTEHIFSRLVFENKVRLTDAGSTQLGDGNGNSFRANFHIFNSTYRIFVLVFPAKRPRTGWRRIIAT